MQDQKDSQKNKEKKEVGQELQKITSMVISASQDQKSGIYYVNAAKGRINLAQILAAVLNDQGSYTPLGLINTRIAGVTTVMTSIHLLFISGGMASGYFEVATKDGESNVGQKSISKNT